MDAATKTALLERGTCPACFYGHNEHREDCPRKHGYAMEADHWAHLGRILEQFGREAGRKYVTGQREHGGRLWEKPQLLDQAILEAIDLVIYLYSLREQQRGA